MIYLDSAATTPIPKAVADAMYDILVNQFGNPSSQYALGREAKKLVDGWRRTIAGAAGCDPRQLHFTSCGTESDNWAISAALWQNRRLGRHIVTTAVEHSAVLEPCKWLENQGYEVTYVEPDKNGDISASQILDAVRPDTALVSVMMVNNETGCIFPIHEIAQRLKRKNPQTLLHTDAVQGFLKVPFSASKLGADFICFSAHKIGGPKGIGALYAGDRVRDIKPLLAGGGQEDGTRSGTEATAQIAGFAKAAELRQAKLAEALAHMAEIKEYAKRKFAEIPDLVPVGDGTAPHILSVSLRGFPSQNIVNDLSEQGICISAGSACHRGKPSHVVAALHLPKEIAGSVIRISFSPDTSKADIDACAAALRHHHDTRCARL